MEITEVQLFHDESPKEIVSKLIAYVRKENDFPKDSNRMSSRVEVESNDNNLEREMGSVTAQKKIYFSGHEDSDDSSFKKASNNLEIGVIAKNKDIAAVLLLFLRIIKDNEINLLFEPFVNFDRESSHDEKLTMSGYVKACHSLLEMNISSFPLYAQFTTKLWSREEKDGKFQYNTVFITKDIADVDVWTLNRIVDQIEDMV